MFTAEINLKVPFCFPEIYTEFGNTSKLPGSEHPPFEDSIPKKYLQLIVGYIFMLHANSVTMSAWLGSFCGVGFVEK